jgi:hypothetical protein
VANSPKNKQHKLIVKLTIVVVILTIVFGGVFATKSKTAQAFDFNQGIFNIFKIPFDVLGKVYEQVNKAYEKLGALGFREGLRKMVSNIAVDTATYIATGDKGQAPMFQTSFADYIKEEGDAFLADSLNNELKTRWGVDLCQPYDPLFKVNLDIYAREYVRKTKPSCTFTKMWEQVQDARKLKLVDMPTYSEIFNPNGNQLGIFLNVTGQVQEGQRNKERLAVLRLQVQDGWKAVRSKITGKIKTPAIFSKIMGTKPFDMAFDEQSVFTGELTADFIGPFANTLVSKLMSQYKQGLLDDKGRASSGLGGAYGPSFGGSLEQAARDRFADLGNPDYNFGGPFKLINELTCDNEESQYTCTINTQMRIAITHEPHYTVREALDMGYLIGNQAFGYNEDKSGGTDDIEDGIYSYRSLVVLRKYRIIPVGWELAAEYFAKYDNSGVKLTLDYLISKYNDKNSPYYRLVDEDWVLKAPETICEKKGPGELLASEPTLIPYDSNNDNVINELDEPRVLVVRKDYCADERSCIKEGDQGCEYYGYCTEEKPVWDIRGEKCEAVFNSCKSYTSRGGSQISYLYNTLQGTVECDSTSVGCREYCSEWDTDPAVNNWACTVSDTDNRIYMNRTAGDSECREDQEGCSRFVRVSSNPNFDLGNVSSYEDYDGYLKVNMRKAPDYYECEGYALEMSSSDSAACEAAGNFWRNDIEKCVESGHEECSNFAIHCEEVDEGCQFYSPVSYSGSRVPGITTDQDTCFEQCVGMKTYMEQESFLDLNSRYVSFMASTAKSCPARDDGCEEFTNVEEGSAGESRMYFSEIRSCVLPSSTGTDTYYTWQSTAEEGNQLRSWTLLKTNDGGDYPCTNTAVNSSGDVSCTDNTEGAHICTVGSTDPDLNPVYNPDCVEFTTTSGGSYWMKFSRIVQSDSDCVPMRRTYDQNVYLINTGKSKTCSSSSVGCREYKGPQANNITNIVESNFESGTQGWSGGATSPESVTANGNSFAASEDKIYTDVSGSVHEGRSYKLSFWAKSRGGNSSITQIYFSDSVDTANANSTFSSSETDLTDNWDNYVFDLTFFNREVLSQEYLVIDAGGDFYIDNIILTETKDDLYLIRGSWVTPSECTAMVGCEEYRDNNGNSHYLKSFDRLCRDELVGCEKMVDMNNSREPGEQPDNGTFPGGVTVEADAEIYLVYNRDKVCREVGCTKLGRVEPDRDNTKIHFEIKYLVVDADDFDRQSSPLCDVSELWCEEYEAVGDNTLDHFKDPNVYTCEYVQGDDGEYRWYKVGDNNAACPGLGSYPTISDYIDSAGSDLGGLYCVGGRSMVDGNVISNTCLADSDCVDYASMDPSGGKCSDWVATCPSSFDQCTEYQDPTTPSGCDVVSVNAEPYPGVDSDAPHCDYYYYKSNTIDTTCREINFEEGCRGFHDPYGGADNYFSTKRCSDDTTRECDNDSDCFDSSGGSLGKCVYK